MALARDVEEEINQKECQRGGGGVDGEKKRERVGIGFCVWQTRGWPPFGRHPLTHARKQGTTQGGDVCEGEWEGVAVLLGKKKRERAI